MTGFLAGIGLVLAAIVAFLARQLFARKRQASEWERIADEPEGPPVPEPPTPVADDHGHQELLRVIRERAERERERSSVDVANERIRQRLAREGH